MRGLVRFAGVFVPVAFSVALAVASSPNCNCKIPIAAAICSDPTQICEGQNPCPAAGLYNFATYSLNCTPNTQGFNTCVGSSARCADKFNCTVNNNGACIQGAAILGANGQQSSTTVTAYFNNTCAAVVCP
jgi:hypothetical protein